MEEREKEAIEFFKSETESEEEQEPEKHEAVNLADNGLVKLTDDPPVSENIDNPQISDETSQEIIKDIPEPELTESELEFKRLTEKYCGDSPIIEAVPGPSTYNPSNFNEVLSTMDEFDDIVDSDKDIVTKIETEKPRIPSLGTNNLIIDLESGDIAEKPLSGAEQLFKRFLKNTTIQKQKSSTCIR